jgi:tetratricopeptide (TPR) repeat protein
LELAAKGDLARALTQWKIVRLLEPRNPKHEVRVEETRRRIREGVRERAARGDAALQRGDTKKALEEFLGVLALDPLDPAAARRLREIEAGYTKSRESAKVNKLLRSTATMGPSRAPPAQPEPTSEAAYYLDTGLELFRQGDYEASAVELEKYLRSYPDAKKARQILAEDHLRLGQAALRAGDNAGAVHHLEEARKSGWTDGRKLETLQQAKKKAAEECYDKGVRASRTDLTKAIEFWKQCLSYDPTHVGARSQLDKALRIQQKLKNIP